MIFNLYNTPLWLYLLALQWVDDKTFVTPYGDTNNLEAPYKITSDDSFMHFSRMVIKIFQVRNMKSIEEKTTEEDYPNSVSTVVELFRSYVKTYHC